MPNARLARTRASLPEGYQFGDASFSNMAVAVAFRETAHLAHPAESWLRVERNRLMTDLMPPVYTKPHGVKIENA